MPPLRRPGDPRTVTLSPRQALVAADTDVLVVGGGPAGLGAAIAASDAGARVILAEQYGFLGGHATAALVTVLASYHTQSAVRPDLPPVTVFPRDHGIGHPVIGGVLKRFVDRLVATGGAIAPNPLTGYAVPFDPEAFKLVSQDLLDEAGAGILYHALASGVLFEDIEETMIRGVVFETKSGPVVINAKVVIDCTGDGDIACFAHAPYEIGRPADGMVQPVTFYFRMDGFSFPEFASYVNAHPGEWNGVSGLHELIRKAREAGELELPREDILFFGSHREGEVGINSTRVTGILGTDVWDLSRAEWEGRRQMRMIAAFLEKYVPGFARSSIIQSGVHVGVRESRRIIGRYVLTRDDVMEAVAFDDVIARGTYPLDIHNPRGKGTVLRQIPHGEAYEIPLRSLLPQRVTNLLVAGRCISGTHEAMAAVRVMPNCFAIGQGAGACAAEAVRHRTEPGNVPASDVQKSLLSQGVDLGERFTR